MTQALDKETLNTLPLNVRRAFSLFDYFEDYYASPNQFVALGLKDFSVIELACDALNEMGVVCNVVICDWMNEEGEEIDRHPAALEVDGLILNELPTIGWADLINKINEINGTPDRFGALLGVLVVNNYIGESTDHALKPLTRQAAGWLLAQEAAEALSSGQVVVGEAQPRSGPRL